MSEMEQSCGCSQKGSSSCGCTGSCGSEPQPKAKDFNKIKHVIAVMSGKGGVGKSSFTGLLAMSLQRKGYKVGILDADITGPSIPKLFGVNKHPDQNEVGVMPVETKKGIKVMSMNLLLPSEDEPVIWRGPIISNVIQQFWDEICWGELDYLVIDLPPGTGDASLTVLQSLSVEGVLIVSSPQDLANMVVRKAIKMVEKMNIPVLGVVENMSYLLCPDCGTKINVFGQSNVKETCDKMGVKLIGHFPLDVEFARLSDAGTIEDYEGNNLTSLEEKLDTILK